MKFDDELFGTRDEEGSPMIFTSTTGIPSSSPTLLEPGWVIVGTGVPYPTDAVVVTVLHGPTQKLHRMVVRHGNQIFVEEYAQTDCFNNDRWLDVSEEPRRTQVIADATAILAAQAARDAAVKQDVLADTEVAMSSIGRAYGASLLGAR